jgi:hypothetical protein
MDPDFHPRLLDSRLMTSNDFSAEPQQGTAPGPTESSTSAEERQAVPSRDSHEDATPLGAQQPSPPSIGLSSTNPHALAHAQVFQRHVLPFLLPLLLLLMVAAVVVVLGSGLLLLGTSDFQLGPVVVAKAVLAAGLSVLMIGSGALWLATRA